MKSTIRMIGPNQYKCKQLNLVSAFPNASITTNDSHNSLVVYKYAKVDLETDTQDSNFSLTVKNISLLSKDNSSASGDLACYISFGYPHAISGFPFVLNNVTASGKDLVITKLNKRIVITFNSSAVSTVENITGPILELGIKHIIKDSADLEFLEIGIGDIEYESL